MQNSLEWTWSCDIFYLWHFTPHMVASMILQPGRLSGNPRTERDHEILCFRFMILRHRYWVILIQQAITAQRHQTAYRVGVGSILTYLSHGGELLCPKIMEKADSVWFNAEIPFKLSPRAKCSPVSLKS